MSKYIKGLVSVIMPTYKRSDKLLRAIDSVLAQTYTNIELLLVNDNEPTDNYTLELKERVKKYSKDKRFNLIMQDKHINGAVARNVGIKLAKGEYIAFLDDDDWWEKEKIERQVEVLKKLPKEWGGVSCKIQFFDENEKLIGKTSKYKDGYIYKDILNLITDVATGTILLRHSALDKSGYFDEELLRHQDLQLLVNFTYQFKLKEVDEFLHCCDVSDTQNRPNGEKLLEHKKKFFKSIKPVLDTLSKKELKCIKCMHQYELGYVFIKNGQKLKGLKYCLSVFTSSKAFMLAIKKTLIKIKTL